MCRNVIKNAKNKKCKLFCASRPEFEKVNVIQHGSGTVKIRCWWPADKDFLLTFEVPTSLTTTNQDFASDVDQMPATCKASPADAAKSTRSLPAPTGDGLRKPTTPLGALYKPADSLKKEPNQLNTFTADLVLVPLMDGDTSSGSLVWKDDGCQAVSDIVGLIQQGKTTRVFWDSGAYATWAPICKEVRGCVLWARTCTCTRAGLQH
jgi:hypothetical protein